MTKKITFFDYPDMQTGPVKGQSMKNWLGWTGWGELSNILMLSLLWGVMWLPYGQEMGRLSFLGLAAANLLLLEGGLYWLLKRRGAFSVSEAWLERLYVFNVCFLLMFPLGWIVRVPGGEPVKSLDGFVGQAFYLLAVGEFAHYFFFKINMRPDELKRALRTRRLIPARFKRELLRSKKRG